MTLEDLIALNDEIAALVRAGVPLERGLAELGGDLPGRLGRLALQLAQRTARGQSLAQAVGHDADGLPPTYRAVVEAGLRAGRLPAALEAVATSARRLTETRRSAVLAVLYPLLVVLLAWVCLIFLTCVLAPNLARSLEAWGPPGPRFFGWLAWAGGGVWYWGPVLPAVLALLAIAAWLGATRPGSACGRWGHRLVGRMPWLGPMLRYSRTATFLELLSLLVEQQTPLPEAIVLAAQAAGDAQLLPAARQMAAALESGQTAGPPGPATFPPLITWLLSAAGREGTLRAGLHHAAAAYHRRARHQADLLRVFLPVVLTIGLGGTVTALYGLALFVPYVSFLHALAR